jgi:hypothetical protein
VAEVVVTVLIGFMIGVCAGLALVFAGLGAFGNAAAFAVAALLWLAVAAIPRPGGAS